MSTLTLYGLFYELRGYRLLLRYLGDSASASVGDHTRRILESKYGNLRYKPCIMDTFNVVIAKDMRGGDYSDINAVIGRTVKLVVHAIVNGMGCSLQLVSIHPINDIDVKDATSSTITYIPPTPECTPAPTSTLEYKRPPKQPVVQASAIPTSPRKSDPLRPLTPTPNTNP